ncbi:MAG: uroporphyrinogen decarboxylase family protein [Planctomycetota bacterium]|jgi:uroporphyrinogen decarboxylase
MTPRENFIAALERRGPQGRVPHYELVFFLTMECFGKVHPNHRSYHQWGQMTEPERQLHREDIARLYVDTAERFEHSAISVHGVGGGRQDEVVRIAEVIRELAGDRYFLIAHADPTYSIPRGSDMADWCAWIYEETAEAKAKAAERVEGFARSCRLFESSGVIDGLAMCCDYCFNTGPFLPPDMFAEVVAPYLKQACGTAREHGLYTIKHTDGNIMPIIDCLVDAGPDALHSLDPQGGVDIAEVKARYGDRVALIGNVNCGMLDTGTEEEVAESVRYCLKHGMPGGGYVFSTSNCIYTGMRLSRYELMLEIWRQEGLYAGGSGGN